MSSFRGKEAAVYFQEHLKNTWLLILFLMVLSGTFTIATNASLAQDESNSEHQHPNQEWLVGNVYFAKVSNAPEFISTNPDFSNTAYYIPNTWLYGESSRVSERRRYLNKGSVVHVEVVSETVARILPEYDEVNPTTYDTASTVYIALDSLEKVPDSLSEPLSVYPETKHEDKLIVVVHDGVNPMLYAFEGQHLVLKVPVVLGPTPIGDFRIWRKRASDDMPGIPAIADSQCFSGGYCMHASYWWNWAELEKGHYGSHGCINLPDEEWYAIQIGDETYSIDEWLFRWTNTGMPFSVTDQQTDERSISSSEVGWYEPTVSTRLIVAESLDGLYDHPVTARLGASVSDAAVKDWGSVVVEASLYGGQWVLPDVNDSTAMIPVETRPTTQTPAEYRGEVADDDTWVMLICSDPSIFNEPAASGASRTVGQMCTHMITERSGSICTPERVDVPYFGKRIYCLVDKFDNAPIELLGELTQHEKIHLVQFSSPKLLELFYAGVAVDDVSPGSVDILNRSLGAWLEFGAQAENMNTTLDNFYRFVLVGINPNGTKKIIDNSATTAQTWRYLHEVCGDPTGTDSEIHELIRRATLMEPDAYDEFTQRCGFAPHELVADYIRVSSK